MDERLLRLLTAIRFEFEGVPDALEVLIAGAHFSHLEEVPEYAPVIEAMKVAARTPLTDLQNR